MVVERKEVVMDKYMQVQMLSARGSYGHQSAFPLHLSGARCEGLYGYPLAFPLCLSNAQCEWLVQLPVGLPSAPVGFLMAALEQLHSVLTPSLGLQHLGLCSGGSFSHTNEFDAGRTLG